MAAELLFNNPPIEQVSRHKVPPLALRPSADPPVVLEVDAVAKVDALCLHDSDRVADAAATQVEDSRQSVSLTPSMNESAADRFLHSAMRRDAAKVLAWDFDRFIPCHGVSDVFYANHACGTDLATWQFLGRHRDRGKGCMEVRVHQLPLMIPTASPLASPTNQVRRRILEHAHHAIGIICICPCGDLCESIVLRTSSLEER